MLFIHKHAFLLILTLIKLLYYNPYYLKTFTTFKLPIPIYPTTLTKHKPIHTPSLSRPQLPRLRSLLLLLLILLVLLLGMRHRLIELIMLELEVLVQRPL